VRQFLEFQNALGVGLFVDAMQRRHAQIFKIARDSLIGREHEFFDDAVREVAHAAHDAGHLAGVVEFNHGFGQIEIDRAHAHAARVQNHRELAHIFKMRRKVRVTRCGFGIAFEHGVNQRVRHAFGGANQAGRDARRENLALRADFHHHAHHQALFVRTQRADIRSIVPRAAWARRDRGNKRKCRAVALRHRAANRGARSERRRRCAPAIPSDRFRAGGRRRRRRNRAPSRRRW
jgi:hypothetical protein